MNEDLKQEARSKIGEILAALAAAFTLTELASIARSGDLSPLRRYVGLAYERVAEVSTSMFLAALARVSPSVHRDLVVNTATWRILEGQARVRNLTATNLAASQMLLLEELLVSGRSYAPSVVALRLSRALGLNEDLYQAVARYESVVTTPSRRELEAKQAATPLQVQIMVEARASQNRDARAQVMGVMAAQEAYGRAQGEAWRQAADKYLVDGNRVARIWHVTGHNTRDSHSPMNDQERPLDVPFTSGLGNSLLHPGDILAPAKDTVNCNCWLTYGLRR